MTLLLILNKVHTSSIYDDHPANVNAALISPVGLRSSWGDVTLGNKVRVTQQ